MQHYGDSVIIADRAGCQDVLYFKDDAKHLLYEFYRQGKLEQNDDEKARVIKLAILKIIVSENAIPYSPMLSS